ncbi:Beta-amylase 1 [Tripterygium wilfordii]|uniref:Beta-amylase n=1 Tax=Tripterygium wilfordii TaxID=458696 RepID=A0A7J7CJY3_TRIWF|nr:Beta-amylase 1 [Tripterygium wilfordii]
MGSPVFVTLPVDAVGPGGQVRRKRAMLQSFRALIAAGVEGVVMEVWWGPLEREQPRAYDWKGYLELVAMARQCSLKVRAVMAFHQCGSGPEDPHWPDSCFACGWIPLPLWVLEEIDKVSDLAYSDRFGRRSTEYISLGCDILPVLQGRSPLQVYTDFMRNFRDTFKPLLGVIITGIQVGMGPAGELRYPLFPSHKLTWAWRSSELGEFQCYDKYMLASLNACARAIGMLEWEHGGPIGASNLMQNPEHTEFFRSKDGYWSTPYGKFFLEWYSAMLLRHGEQICREAEAVFRGTKVSTSANVAGIHWHYGIKSHPSELTTGYYNTSTRDGQLLSAAKICEIKLEGENSVANLDDESFKQVLKMSKFYSDDLEKPSFSVNFVRMDKNMFEYRNWVHFTGFVWQMPIFFAKLDSGAEMQLSSSPDAKVGVAFAYC